MESVIEEVGDFLLSDVLQEAVDEVKGRSKRKWALVLLAAVLGGVWIGVTIRKRRRSAEDSAPAVEFGTATAPLSEPVPARGW